MTDSIAVLGGGAGGLATAVELGLRGFGVRYWARSAPAHAAAAEGGLIASGALSGTARPELLTSDLAEALDGASSAVVVLPAPAFPSLLKGLVDAASSSRLPPLVLNPGHTGGALHVSAALAEAGIAPPPIVELSTLTYVARSTAPATVDVTGVARQVRGAACFDPEGRALELAVSLFPQIVTEADVLATSLANVNLVLHPPGALTAAAWVEATGGAFTFYGDAMTDGVARMMRALDDERRAVAAAFGHELPPLELEMAAIGTADATSARAGDLRRAVAGGAANAAIRAPDSLHHRYYREDFGYGVAPFVALAAAAGVEVPLAEALLTAASALVGVDFAVEGLTAERMGIAGAGRVEVLELVRSSAREGAGR